MCVFDLPEEWETRWVIKVKIGNCIGWEHGAGTRVVEESKQSDIGFIEIKLRFEGAI